jgi:hypothetical protein
MTADFIVTLLMKVDEQTAISPVPVSDIEHKARRVPPRLEEVYCRGSLSVRRQPSFLFVRSEPAILMLCESVFDTGTTGGRNLFTDADHRFQNAGAGD